jgi:hypothetical protein
MAEVYASADAAEVRARLRGRLGQGDVIVTPSNRRQRVLIGSPAAAAW